MHNGPNDLATALHVQSKLDECVALFRTAFTLARDGCSRHDMLAHPSRYNTATNRRQERRPLTAEELAWLLDVTEDASTDAGFRSSHAIPRRCSNGVLRRRVAEPDREMFRAGKRPTGD